MVNAYYTKKGITYIMRIITVKEMSKLQYNVSLGWSTIWFKYGEYTAVIFVAMEMKELYIDFSLVQYSIATCVFSRL